MANNNEDYREPAGLDNGTYVVDCSLLALMATLEKGQKVGASLKTTGQDVEKVESTPLSTKLDKDVVIQAYDGGRGNDEDGKDRENR